MDGKDKIIEQILSEAESYRLSVVTKADEEYSLAIDTATKKAEEIIATEEASLKKEEEEAIERKRIVASLDGKKLYLSKKTEAVDEVFSLALDKLKNLEKSAYRSVIYRLIKENAEENAKIVIAKNSPLSKEEVLDFDVCKKLSLSVSCDGDFSGGVIIEGKTADINLSFEAIIDGLKEKYQTSVADKLFD